MKKEKFFAILATLALLTLLFTTNASAQELPSMPEFTPYETELIKQSNLGKFATTGTITEVQDNHVIVNIVDSMMINLLVQNIKIQRVGDKVAYYVEEGHLLTYRNISAEERYRAPSNWKTLTKDYAPKEEWGAWDKEMTTLYGGMTDAIGLNHKTKPCIVGFYQKGVYLNVEGIIHFWYWDWLNKPSGKITAMQVEDGSWFPAAITQTQPRLEVEALTPNKCLTAWGEK